MMIGSDGDDLKVIWGCGIFWKKTKIKIIHFFIQFY